MKAIIWFAMAACGIQASADCMCHIRGGFITEYIQVCVDEGYTVAHIERTTIFGLDRDHVPEKDFPEYYANLCQDTQAVPGECY